jgi:hypothetical protein
MTTEEYAGKLDQLEHLLNDPNVPMQPLLIWRLLEEISQHETAAVRAPAHLVKLTSLDS